MGTVRVCRVTPDTSLPAVQDPGWWRPASTSSGASPWTPPTRAKSGHSGTAMALAPLAHVLWTRIMHYDPQAPSWPDRDRFVLSCGHACILQYAMLHLTGYDLSLEDLRQFRQWGSRTAGSPRGGPHPGPRGDDRTPGSGLRQRGRARRGGALGAQPLRPEVCDHRTYVVASDGCMMEGISHEAASLAGHLGLGRLLAVYDDNHITIDGPTELAYGDDVVGRFAAYGWRVRNLGRDGQRRGRPRGRHPGGARSAGRRSRCPADAAHAAQPHRLALTARSPTPPRPTATLSAPRRSR